MFGSRLREERERLSITQEQMSIKTGVSKRTFIKWEKGETSPTAEQLSSLIALGVDVMYVLTGVRSKPAPKTYTQPEPKAPLKAAEDTGVYNANTKPLNKREQALLANYRESDEEAKKALESTARAFSRQDQKDGTSGK